MNAKDTLEAAYRAHGSGDVDAARRGYDAVLRADPDHVDALQLRGLVALQEGQFERAVQLIERALAHAPRHPTANLNLALAYRELGRRADAAEALRRQLVITPDAHDVRLELALALSAAGGQAGDEAAWHLAACARQRPDAQTFTRLAEVLLARDAAGALDAAQRALSLDADAGPAQVVVSVALWRLNRHAEARAAARRALAIDPTNADAHANLGALLLLENKLAAARQSLDAALALAPRHAPALAHSAVVSLHSGEPARALAECDRALAADPAHADARFNRADVLARLQRWEEAAAELGRLLDAVPGYPYASGQRFFCELMSCQWEQHAERARALQRDVEQGRDSVSPFVFLAVSDDPALQLRCAADYASRRHPALAAAPHAAKPPGARLVVAVVSADFHAHATAYLIAGVLEALDHSEIEWIAVSTGPRTGDAYQQRLLGCFDHVVDALEMPDTAVAAALRARGVDIVIDLKGYTGGGRPGILALRPAPLQLAWLGYPGTSGAPYVDAVIADAQVLPAELEPHFSERVIRLPGCYQPNDGRRVIAERRFARDELGLPPQGFVFCCFNAAFKITPQVFGLWMQLLQQVPDGVLWLLDDNAAATRNLRAAAAEHGIEPARLVFAPRLPLAEHLARQRAADLFVDTWPVNAHTTASDALWAGLPLLTRRTRCFAGRVAASLLTTLQLGELVVDSDDAYTERALQLAREPARLQALRQRLAEQRERGPLFDSAHFARMLERTLHTLHRRRLQGEPLAALGAETA